MTGKKVYPKKNNRPDHSGTHRRQYEINKKKILATQDICGICGNPVDKSKKYPDPKSACIDHIIPVSKGGHPSDISNLQLAHLQCNCIKASKITDMGARDRDRQDRLKNIGINNLPWSADWLNY